MDIRKFLIDSGFNEDINGFTKEKQIAFAHNHIHIKLGIVISNFKYSFYTELSSPVFLVKAEKDKMIDSLTWSPRIINVFFEDLIREAFKSIASDVINKIIPIEDRL